jgi:hypothetical protein
MERYTFKTMINGNSHDTTELDCIDLNAARQTLKLYAGDVVKEDRTDVFAHDLMIELLDKHGLLVHSISVFGSPSLATCHAW